MMVTTVRELVPQTSRLVKANPAQGNWPTVPDSQREAAYEGSRQSQISGYYDPIPKPDSHERLGVHRRQQFRPQRAASCCTAPRPRTSPTAAVGRGGRRSWGGGTRRLRCGRTAIGEMSIRQIDGKTVLSYFNATTGNMEVRVADDPTGLGTAPVTTVVVAADWPDPVEQLGPPEDNRLGAAVRRLHLAGFHARRVEGVRQPVEHHAARRDAVPGDSVRGEPVQALVRGCLCGSSPQSVRSSVPQLEQSPSVACNVKRSQVAVGHPS